MQQHQVPEPLLSTLPTKEEISRHQLQATSVRELSDQKPASIISDTNMDIDQKIKNNVKPLHEDKKKLQNRIKQLNKKEQLHLFHNIIKPLEIYTITDNGTFFDLNELSSEDFWKLSYQVNLTYDCIQRDRAKSGISSSASMLQPQESRFQYQQKGEHDTQAQAIYNSEFDIESNSIVEQSNENGSQVSYKDSSKSVNPPNYSQLRDEALKDCSVTHASEDIFNQLSTEYESKVLERNVYTDKKKR